MSLFPPTITEFDSGIFLPSGNIDAGRLAWDGTNFWQALLHPDTTPDILLIKYAASGAFVTSYGLTQSGLTGAGYAPVIAAGGHLWVGADATAGNNTALQVLVTGGVPAIVGAFLFTPAPSTATTNRPEFATDGTSLYVLQTYVSSGNKVVATKVNPATGAVVWQGTARSWSVTTSNIATDGTWVYYAVNHILYQDACSDGTNHATHDGTGASEFIIWVAWSQPGNVLWAWDNSGNQCVYRFNPSTLAVTATIYGSDFFPSAAFDDTFQALSVDSDGNIWIGFVSFTNIAGHDVAQVWIAVYDPTGATQLWLHSFPEGSTSGGMESDPDNGPLYNLVLVGTTMWGAIISGTGTSPADYQYALLGFSPPTSPLGITCDNPPPATVGVPYSHAFPATGGVPPYTWSITAGALPDGLSLDPATGIVSGTPTTSAVFAFTITVRDSSPGAPVTVPPTPQGYDIGDAPRGHFGGFYAGAHYLFLHAFGQASAGLGDQKIHALKSSDGGATWVELDAAHAPYIYFGSSPLEAYSVSEPDGSTIYVNVLVAAFGGGGTTITGYQSCTFDLSTGLWSALSATNTTPAIWPWSTAMGNTICVIDLARRGAGNYVFTFSGALETVGGSQYGRIYACTWNGSTFGTPVMLPGQAGDARSYTATRSVVDSAGITHFFLMTPGAPGLVKHVAMAAGAFGTFGTPGTVSAQFYTFGDPGYASEPSLDVVVGVETLSIALTVWDAATSRQAISFYKAAAVLNPVWTPDPGAIITENALLVESIGANSVFDINTAVYYAAGAYVVVWLVAQSSRSYYYGGKVYQSISTDGGATWSAPAVLWTAPNTASGINNFNPQQIMLYNAAGALVIGASFNDPGDSSPDTGSSLFQVFILSSASVACSISVGPAPPTCADPPPGMTVAPYPITVEVTDSLGSTGTVDCLICLLTPIPVPPPPTPPPVTRAVPIHNVWESGLVRGGELAASMIRVGACDVWARGNGPLICTIFSPDKKTSVQPPLDSLAGVPSDLMPEPGIQYSLKFDMSQVENYTVRFETNSLDGWLELSGFRGYTKDSLFNR